MVNKRAQRILAQISGQDREKNEKVKVNELSLSKGELIGRIYARQSANGKGEFVALPWDFYKEVLNVYDSFVPKEDTPVTIEPQFKYKNNQPVGIDRIWVHIIIGKTDDGKDLPRTILFKGSKELPTIEKWEDLVTNYTFGWYRGRNIKKDDGTIIPKGKWYFACRPKAEGDKDLIDNGEDRLNAILEQDKEEAANE